VKENCTIEDFQVMDMIKVKSRKSTQSYGNYGWVVDVLKDKNIVVVNQKGRIKGYTPEQLKNLTGGILE
jgi:hypothetical protein